MKITFLVLLVVIVLGAVAYYVRFPRNKYVSIDRPSDGKIVFSRLGVSLEPPPDHFAQDGFDHIEPYVFRLLQKANGDKSLSMFTPDGERGFGLNANNGLVRAIFTVESGSESQREAAIRSFFSSLAISPTEDYVAGNGEVADAIRVIEYPIHGNAADVTALAKRILQDLCGVSPAEALDIAILRDTRQMK